MSRSYNSPVTPQAHPRLNNLLASLSLNLSREAAVALEGTTGLSGNAPAALLALHEFLDEAHIGRLADALGLTHSGTVRLVDQLEAAGLVERVPGTDRRRMQVRLTGPGHRRATAARAAREAVLTQATGDLTGAEVATLEGLLERLIAARVTARMQRRQDGETGAWWCRTCDFTACGRDAGRCPAQAAASRAAGIE